MSLPGKIFSFAVMLCLLGGIHYYIARRIYQCIIHIFPNINSGLYTGVSVLTVCVIFLGFARSLLPFPAALKSILGSISSYWMGILIYLLLFLVLADVILFLGAIINVIPKPITAHIRFFSGLLSVLMAVGTVGYGIYNASHLKLVSYDVQIEKKILKSEINMVLISDLHLGAVNSEQRLARMVQHINELHPDVVCIAGDIFDNDYYAICDPDKAVNEFKRINSTYGVYAALGNHDGGKTLREMLHFLERSDVKVLNDQYTVLDNRLILAGRLDGSPIGGFEGMSRSDFAEVIREADMGLPVVVMDHNPANIDEYGYDVDLILSGHTHRGQVFPGSLFTRAMFTADYGHYQRDSESAHVIVTSGVVTWGMPMRVGTNCEIVQVKLH